MAVTATKREPGTGTGFPKKVGFAECDVVAFNPTAEELGKILGVEIEKEIEYESEDSEGNRKLRLDVWLREVFSKNHFKLRLQLTDKEGVSEKGKKRFIDKKGNLSYWIDDEANLQDFMKRNDPWVSRMGEYDLYNFLKAFQSDIQRDSKGVPLIDDFTIDWRRLIRGDVKELNSLVGNEFSTSVGVVLCVNLKKDGDEIKEYQDIYTRAFLPGGLVKFLRNPGGKSYKSVDRFISEVTDPEYGCKSFYGGTYDIIKEGEIGGEETEKRVLVDRKLVEIHDYYREVDPNYQALVTGIDPGSSTESGEVENTDY